MKKTLLLLLYVLIALSACKREDPQSAIAAQAAAKEQAAEAAARQFEDAYAQQNWELARGYGDMLLMEHPDSAAAGRIKERLDDARAKVAAAAEQRRLAALWAYASEPAKGGAQLSALIFSQQPVDVDGSGAKPVQLVFRDHPDWGRSSYLVLERGDFDCYGGCKVQVKIDDAAAKPMAAYRPKTDEAIAMFIEDEKALWRLAKDAQRIVIEFPVKAGGKRTAMFEVGGLDRTKLPGWN